MLSNLFKLSVAAATFCALSATALPVIRAELAVSASVTAEFCQAFNFGDDCVFLFPENDGECLSFTGFITTNGISSFNPLQSGVSCNMFTNDDCTGDVWTSGMAIPDFQLLAFNGMTLNDAPKSATCTGGS